jgi:hypothetical protein
MMLGMGQKKQKKKWGLNAAAGTHQKLQYGLPGLGGPVEREKVDG